MHHSNGPPQSKNRLCHTTTTQHIGLGNVAAGRYTFATTVGRAGIAITSVNGGRASMANRT